MAHQIPGPRLLEIVMPVLPSQQSFQVLLAWSHAVETRRGWVRLTPTEVPALAGMSCDEVQGCISELSSLGLCTRAAHGDLVYLSRQGARLARVVREMIAEGTALPDVTLELLAPRLAGIPFFRLPEPLAFREASHRRSALAAG